MIEHDLIQGSPEWMAHRAQYFNASDAPAMVGCSPYKTRTQLLHELHTGLVPEVDSATQRRFDDGHRFEALARPLANAIIGLEVYPVVGSSGKFSASFDGLTMCETIAFEHKSLNAELRELMEEGDFDGARLPLQYRVQMEQQLMVSGAERVLFMASKWDGDTLIEERHCWYASDPELADKIDAGWEQFAADLAAYTPPAAAPVVVAEQVQALPAVLVQVSGEISVKDNFKVFETAMRDFLEHRLIRAPKSDQDFADLDVQIKAMKGAEAALEGAEVQMLAQVQPVDQAKKTKDMLLKLVRENRLMAEKVLASEKDRRRTEIVMNPAKELQAHIAALNERLGRPYMPPITVDFGQVIKGMRSLSSMEDAVATRLATAKIDANAAADRLQVNLNHLRDTAADYKHLFPDTGTIIQKAPDDLKALVSLRISEHKAEVEKKEQETRERIRAEEQAKAEKDARDKLAREAEEQRLADEATTRAAAEKELATAKELPEGAELSPAAQTLNEAEGAQRFAAAHPKVANVVPMRAPAPAAAPATPPTLKLGQIGERLGFSLTGEFLKNLGFEPAARDKSALLFHEADFPLICMHLVAHIQVVQAKQAA